MYGSNGYITHGVHLYNPNKQNLVTVTNTANINVDPDDGVNGDESNVWAATDIGTTNAQNTIGSEAGPQTHAFGTGVLLSYGSMSGESGTVINSDDVSTDYISAVNGPGPLIARGDGTAYISGPIQDIGNLNPDPIAGVRLDYGGSASNRGSISARYGSSSGFGIGLSTITNYGTLQNGSGSGSYQTAVVTNFGGGSITGGFGIDISPRGNAASTEVAAAVAGNSGGRVLSGSGTHGVYLYYPAQNPVTVTNAAHYNVNNGYFLKGNISIAWNITNSGTADAQNTIKSREPVPAIHQYEQLFTAGVTAGIFPSYGVVLDGTGTVTNAGYIAAVNGSGILVDGNTGTVNNSGTIKDIGNAVPGLAAGVRTDYGGFISNSGLISGRYGILSGFDIGSSTITNSGVIQGQNGSGLYQNAGILIFNDFVAPPATLSNSVTNYAGGSISGGVGIDFTRVAYNPTTSTVVNAGTITGNNGTAVLFASGNDLLVAYPGAVFVGNVDGGGSAGSNTLRLAAGAGTGTLAGLGTSFVNFGTVVINAGASWIVTLPNPAAFTGPIYGFAPADIIDLTGRAATSLSYSGGTLTVRNGVNVVATLNLPGSFSSANFHLSSDGNGGTEISLGTPPPTATSDFNGEGKSDILFQNTNGQPAAWLINGTTPISEPLVGSNPGSSWQVITARDFNGDGDADILFQNTNGQPAVWLMSGTTPFSEQLVGTNPGPSWHVIGAGDFNGNVDHDADILFQNDSGQAAVWLMNGTTPFSEQLVGANPGPSWHVVGTGDFNGDRDSDILWQNTNGQPAIWLMNGTTPFSQPTVGANPGPSWHIVGAGDFNGDGDADILFQNDNGQAAIWLMNGTTPFSEQLVGANPGPSWHIVGAGDFNGDGKSDILFQNDNGQAAIWLMSGTTPTAEVLVGSNPGPSWHIHAAS
jgi:hypothetical protein